jgi:glycerophosphoryl diester phosphodiesterase
VHRPLVIAHRGASGYRPENTLPAMEYAIALGADMIETDLHVTRDGVVVIAHDEELERLGGQGRIGEASLADLRGLDAGEGAVIPTLDELLDCVDGRLPLNLELKSSAVLGDYRGLEAQALGAVRGRGLLEQVLFSAFSVPVVERLRALEPSARIGLLVTALHGEGAVERAVALGAESLNPWVGMVDRSLVESAHGAGLAVHSYTANSAEEMGKLLDLGVDGIFTNFPDRLRELIRARD